MIVILLTSLYEESRNANAFNLIKNWNEIFMDFSEFHCTWASSFVGHNARSQTNDKRLKFNYSLSCEIPFKAGIAQLKPAVIYTVIQNRQFMFDCFSLRKSNYNSWKIVGTKLVVLWLLSAHYSHCSHNLSSNMKNLRFNFEFNGVSLMKFVKVHNSFPPSDYCIDPNLVCAFLYVFLYASVFLLLLFSAISISVSVINNISVLMCLQSPSEATFALCFIDNCSLLASTPDFGDSINEFRLLSPHLTKVFALMFSYGN